MREHDPVEEFHQQFFGLNRAGKWLVIVYVSLAGTGCTFATLMLLGYRSWIAKATALLLTEPIAVACLLALITLIAPDSLAARFFGGAMQRASIVVRGLLVVAVVSVIGDLAYLLYLLVRT